MRRKADMARIVKQVKGSSERRRKTRQETSLRKSPPETIPESSWICVMGRR